MMNTIFNQKNLFRRSLAVLPFLVLLSALLLACAGSPRAASYGGLGRAGDSVPFREDIRTGTLPSGLRYYILENSKPENRAFLTLAVNAGSVLETDDEQGLAHFVEHMAFNGTTRFPEADLLNYLRSLGMRFGADVNAYTSFDETVYGIEVPTEKIDEKKYIPATALAVIDDWTRAITFDPKDVDDERPIIMEEYRLRLGAQQRVQRQLLPALFQGSPYAERLPIGLPEIIESAPASRLENFYKKWYRADNMALILVGDFDGAALEASLTEHFSIPLPDTPLNRPKYDLPPPKKGSFEATSITDPELPYSAVYLYYKRSPEAPRQDLAAYRRGLIDNLIDQMLSLRFEEAGTRPEAPYVYAGGGTASYGASSRFYVLMAQAKTGPTFIDESLRALLREKESILRYGFTAGELDLASRSLLSTLEQMVSEKNQQESGRYIRELTSHFLNGELVPGIEWELEAVRLLLPGIGPKDIQAAVKDYFAADALQVFITAPEAEQAGIPPEAQIRQIIASVKREKLSPPKDSALGDELVTRLPDPGTITAEQLDTATGALIWELENGARVILKETKNRNNEIILYAAARGGTASVPREIDISAGLAAEMFSASGAGPYTRTELVKKLMDKQVSLSFWVSDYQRGFQGAASTGDIKTLFELLYLNFTDPRLDPDAVAALMDQYRTSLAQRNENPNAAFSDEISRTTSGDHYHFKPLELADLDKVNPGEALDFLDLCLNPADYTFIFTGNLDIPLLRPLIETYLSSIPPGEQNFNQWTDLNIQRPGRLEKNVYKGKEEQSQVFMAWYALVPYSEEGSIAAQALEEYLDIKLTEEIREALGGVYSISAGVGLSPVPRSELSLRVYFGCDPRRAAELSAAVEQQLALIAAGTIDNSVFTKSRETLIKSLEVNVQSNLYIAQSYANSSVILHTPLDRLNRRAGLFQALKPADIQALAVQLQGKGPARVVLYPEGWR